MTDIRHALPQGCRLDEYEFVRVLGHGGFGVTYLAKDVNLGKEVAIKEYFPTDLVVREGGFSVRVRSQSDEDDYEYGLDRFLDEARTLAQFRHPNIVVIHRFFRANGTAYLIMDYEHGEQFGTMLSQRRTLPEKELLDLVHPLLEGLADVHDAGILHRDIKPENIYVRENGSPVLIDFGAARQALSSRSKTLTAVLTPGYAPFEQYYSSGDQGPWTDIYAMASVLYRAVTGEDPVESVARMDTDSQKPATDAAMGRYKKHFLEAIDAGMAVKPGDRPQSVQEFAAMLDGVRGAKRAGARKAAAAAAGGAAAASGRRTTRAAGGRLLGNIPIGAAVAGGVLLAAGIGIAAWLGSGSDDPPQQASGGSTAQSGATAGASGAGNSGGGDGGSGSTAGAGATSGESGAATKEAEHLAEERRKAVAERKRLEEERKKLEAERKLLTKEKSKEAGAASKAAAEARRKAEAARKAEAKAKARAKAAAAAAKKTPAQTATKTPPKKPRKTTKTKAGSSKIDAWCSRQEAAINAKYDSSTPKKCAEVDRPTTAGMANESYGQTECGQQNQLREYRMSLRKQELATLKRRCAAMRRGDPVLPAN